jgi:hypothetical protein
MKQITKNQIDALNKIRNSKGRFFGLYTSQGDVINAQFVNESDAYVTVYDRNNFSNRKLAKTSIDSVSLG